METHPRGHVVVGRERQERVIVVVRVAEGDQAFMTAAVMPFQADRRQGQGDALVQDALHVLLVGVLLVENVRLEEGCGRQLLGISHDDERFPPRDGGHGFGGRELGRLVKDDQVELTADGLQILRDGERAHEHAGTQAREQVRDPVEQIPERYAAGIVPDRLLENRHFLAAGKAVIRRGKPGSHLGDQLPPGRLPESLVVLAELLDKGFEQFPAEDTKPLFAVDDMHGIRPIEALEEEVFQPVRSHPARFELVGDQAQPQSAEARFLPGIDGVGLEFGKMVAPPPELFPNVIECCPGNTYSNGAAQFFLQLPGFPPEGDTRLCKDGFEPVGQMLFHARAIFHGRHVEQLAVSPDSRVADGRHIIPHGGLQIPESTDIQ